MLPLPRTLAFLALAIAYLTILTVGLWPGADRPKDANGNPAITSR